jgi:hypothetical protein
VRDLHLYPGIEFLGSVDFDLSDVFGWECDVEIFVGVRVYWCHFDGAC